MWGSLNYGIGKGGEAWNEELKSGQSIGKKTRSNSEGNNFICEIKKSDTIHKKNNKIMISC